MISPLFPSRPGDDTIPRLPNGKVDPDALLKKCGLEKYIDLGTFSDHFWPEDESVDDFLQARREWRKESRKNES